MTENYTNIVNLFFVILSHDVSLTTIILITYDTLNFNHNKIYYILLKMLYFLLYNFLFTCILFAKLL